MLADADGQWVLANHPEARCEWAISGVDANGQLQNAVLDRYFESDISVGLLTIKPLCPQTQPRAFLARAKGSLSATIRRYRALIERLYADNPKPVRIALYFTGSGNCMNFESDNLRCLVICFLSALLSPR